MTEINRDAAGNEVDVIAESWSMYFEKRPVSFPVKGTVEK
jgi:hypothetical protein